MAPGPTPAGRIDALPALEGTETRLLALLETITRDDWEQPTIVPSWQVRHIAGHLLDTALRRLALTRDQVAVDGPASGAPDDVRAFVDRVNAEGAQVYGRLSPAVVLSLMAPASDALRAWLAGRDPDRAADFPVSWAGDQTSPHWFDVARELTERWHHQQQIRLALGRPDIMSRELYHPVLDCFMRALPHAYRAVAATAGTHLAVRVTGEAGGVWRLHRGDADWRLTLDDLGPAAGTVTIPGPIAWRVFTKGIAPAEAERQSQLEGDRSLIAPLFSTRAIVG